MELARATQRNPISNKETAYLKKVPPQISLASSDWRWSPGFSCTPASGLRWMSSLEKEREMQNETDQWMRKTEGRRWRNNLSDRREDTDIRHVKPCVKSLTSTVYTG